MTTQHKHTPTKRVGILGGGQLARMLCIEGFKMGFEMHVLSAAGSDPAAQVTRYWHQGDVNSTSDVKKFFLTVDVATFESEFLSEKILLEAEAATSISLRPRVHLISELSDRLKQKSWLERFRIPTSPFSSLLTTNDVYNFINRHGKNFATVFKKRRLGYDGYGTFIIREKKQLLNWLAENENQLHEFIVEDFQPFKRELAVQFAVNSKGEILTYPLVEWQAENSRCLWVKGPAKTKFKSQYAKMLKQIEFALIENHYVGAIAFELFETSKGIIVNEIAPRVHNSAHYTLEAFSMNQFKAHLAAINNETLPKKISATSKGFAMVNLLGDKNPPEVTPTGFVHWYGKTESREGRKMGHLTVLSESGDRALKEALKIKRSLL